MEKNEGSISFIKKEYISNKRKLMVYNVLFTILIIVSIFIVYKPFKNFETVLFSSAECENCHKNTNIFGKYCNNCGKFNMCWKLLSKRCQDCGNSETNSYCTECGSSNIKLEESYINKEKISILNTIVPIALIIIVWFLIYVFLHERVNQLNSDVKFYKRHYLPKKDKVRGYKLHQIISLIGIVLCVIIISFIAIKYFIPALIKGVDFQRYCENGHSNYTFFDYCPECGKELAYKYPKRCDECGHSISTNDLKYCSKCGNNLLKDKLEKSESLKVYDILPNVFICFILILICNSLINVIVSCEKAIGGKEDFVEFKLVEGQGEEC